MKIAIIGAGPAGLYAAIKCEENNFDYTIFEATDTIGGQLIALYPEKLITNIPGIDSIKAADYIALLAEKIDCSKIKYNARINTVDELKSDEYDTVIVAAGIGHYEPRKLGVAGDDRPNVLYTLKDYDFLKNKKVIVFGGGDSALDWSAQLSNLAEVSLVHRRDEFRGNADTIKDKNIKIYLSYVPEQINENTVVIKSTKDNTLISLDYDYILVNYGMQYQKSCFSPADKVYFVGDYCEQTRTIAFGMQSVDDAFKHIKIMDEIMTIKNVKILQFNTPTKTGRIYSPDCINLDDPVLQERLDNKCIFGAVNPDDSNNIAMDEVSHAISKLTKTADGLYADIDILPTPAGKVLRTLIDTGAQIEFSVSGTGNVSADESGNSVVDADSYEFNTANAYLKN